MYTIHVYNMYIIYSYMVCVYRNTYIVLYTHTRQTTPCSHCSLNNYYSGTCHPPDSVYRYILLRRIVVILLCRRYSMYILYNIDCRSLSTAVGIVR